MGGWARSPAEPGIRGEAGTRPRPATGSVVAGAGAAVTLGSLFLPWYVVHLRITGYASLSVFAMLHVGNMHLSCAPRAGASCAASATVDALAAGVWDWRALIAVGAAGILLLQVFRAMNRGRPPGRLPHWQAVTAVAAATAACVLAAVLADPLTVPGAAGLGLSLGRGFGLSASLSYGAAVGLAGAVVAVAGGLLLRDRILCSGSASSARGPHPPGAARAEHRRAADKRLTPGACALGQPQAARIDRQRLFGFGDRARPAAVGEISDFS